MVIDHVLYATADLEAQTAIADHLASLGEPLGEPAIAQIKALGTCSNDRAQLCDAVTRGSNRSAGSRYESLADAALAGRLAAVATRPDAVLHMRTDPGASYDRFATVLDVVKRAGIERLGFIGNDTMLERKRDSVR